MDPTYLKTLIFAAQKEKHSQRTTHYFWKHNDPTCSSAHFSRARVAFWANSHKERIKRTTSAENKLLCQKQGICIFVAAIFALLTFLWQEIFLCWKFIPFPHSMQKNGKMFQFYLKPTTIHTYRNCVVFAQLYDFVD